MPRKSARTKASESAKKESFESFMNQLQLVIEDVDWKKQTSSIFGDDTEKVARDALVEQSINTYRNHPAYKHIIELNKSFVLGKGVQRPLSRNPLIQYCIDSIYDNKENKRTFTGYRAQERIQEQKDMTGEVFFKIYLNTKTGESIVRLEKDTSKIQEIVTLEGDKDYILYYKYIETRKKFDYTKGKYVSEKSAPIYIQDILADEDDINESGNKGAEKDDIKIYGFFVAFGNAGELSLRGLPIYHQIFKYLKAHKQVAEDSATILKALSMFAWKKKYKNMGKSQLEGLKKMAQTFNSDLSLNKTKPATGATLLETDSVDNQQVDIKHNGAAFWDTSRILIQQIASGSQKMEHYFGNPANSNLATATSMELPMLKDFERQQAEFAEIFETVIRFLVFKLITIKTPKYISEKAKEEGYDLPIEDEELKKIQNELERATWNNLDIAVVMPEILHKQAAQLILSAINSYNAGLILDIDASALIYTLLGYNNVDDKVSGLYGDTYSGEPGEGDDIVSKADKLKQEQEDIDKEDNKDDPTAKGEGEEEDADKK